MYAIRSYYALIRAEKNIRKFHEKQKHNSFIDSSKDGIMVGQIIRPIEKVGIYVPGGTAAYPSTVLMNAVPAKIARITSYNVCYTKLLRTMPSWP